MKLSVSATLTGTFIGLLLASPAFAFQITEQHGQVSVTDQVVETGSDGRAQVDLSDGAKLRVGKDSKVQSGEDMPQLISGTVLFDFGSAGTRLAFQHAGVDLQVIGGTGFAHHADAEKGKVVLVGSLAGKVVVKMAGESHRLKPGQLAVIDAEGKITFNHYNIDRLAGSSSLLNDFTSKLPGEKAIRREQKQYVSLEKRGFVRSGTANETTMLASREMPIGSMPDVTRVALNAQALTSPTSSSAGGLIMTFDSSVSTAFVYGETVIDEIRVGHTFSDVIPIVGLEHQPAQAPGDGSSVQSVIGSTMISGGVSISVEMGRSR